MILLFFSPLYLASLALAMLSMLALNPLAFALLKCKLKRQDASSNGKTQAKMAKCELKKQNTS